MTGGVQPAGVITASGELWLPSTKGAVRIVPERPERRTPVSLSDRAGDRRWPARALAAELSLPPGDGKLEIHYTSIRLGSPERVCASSTGWRTSNATGRSPASARVAYYTNIPPGTYRFHVAAYEMNAPQNATVSGPGHRLAAALLSHALVPRALRADARHGGVGRLPAARAQHPPAVRRRARGAQPARARDARHADSGLRRRVDAARGGVPRAGGLAEPRATTCSTARGSEVRAAVDEARLAVWNLRRGSRDTATGLVPAVSQLARRIGLEAGIDIRVQIDGPAVSPSAATPRAAC